MNKENYKFIGKSVWLEKERILVIADLHLGYEESLNIAIPKSQYKTIIEDLNLVFEEIDKLDDKRTINKKQTINNKGELVSKSSINNKKEKKIIKELIILGDLKHEFSQASSQEWREVLDLLDFLKEKSGKITIIKGNHDNYLISIIKKADVKLVDFYIKDDLAFIHGDKQFIEILDKKIKIWFVGHFHPAILLEKEAKRETYKCFLQGRYKDKEVIILPSFFPLIEGADVNKEDTNLAYNFDLGNFEVYIPAENSVLDFGKLKDVGRLI